MSPAAAAFVAAAAFFRITVTGAGKTSLYRLKGLSFEAGGETMTDGEIVEKFLARDEDALRHTAEKYGARLQIGRAHV